MLELDLLLGAFANHGYNVLDDAGRLAFERLLEYPDQVLLDILMGRMAPADPGIAHVVTQIRGATVSPA
ncbi:FAD assembly factor SdhE [Acidihalobacter prosperus]